MPNRDDFTKPTVDTLARRVGYLCSNPSCRKHTSGPNSNDNKSTLIGIAAHITAAAPGGPRYDSSLSPDERKGINNGIWLCSNCATLIDKDELTYSTELLKFWKTQLEFEMSKSLAGQSSSITTRRERPILEAELHYSSARGGPQDYSRTYKMEWNFNLIIQNNSKFPAYHVKIIPDNHTKLKLLNSTSTTNNLAPLASLTLDAYTQLLIQGDGMDAEPYLKANIPSHLNGSLLKISYKDEDRNEHITMVSINDNEVVNELSK